MKKLLTMVVAACAVAFAANAASVKWQMKPGSDYEGWTGYLVSDTTTLAATLATVLDEAEAPTAWVNAVKPTVATDTISKRGTAAGTVLDVGSASTYTVVLFNGDIVAGTEYAVLETLNVADYSYSGAATPTTMSFTTKKAGGTLTVGGSTPTPTPTPVVPEPTSGLLLLVGGAALALRRKQK